MQRNCAQTSFAAGSIVLCWHLPGVRSIACLHCVHGILNDGPISVIGRPHLLASLRAQ